MAAVPDAMENAPTAQTYRERPPVALLREHLSSVWVQSVSSDAAPYAHRTIPNGGVEIVCELGSAPRVIGPQTGPTVDVLAPGTTIVGVRFRPGAAPAVLGLPASELVDLAVGSEELWGSAAARLGEELSACAGAGEAVAVLEREVFARLDRGAPLDPIVTETVRLLRPDHASEVGVLSSSLYLSERQLRRRCLAAIGLAPKAVQRMLRFQGFLALAHTRGLAHANLARLAADAGYADQPHLTRECLSLAGSSPRTLLREAEEHCRGAHDHAASYAPLLQPGR